MNTLRSELILSGCVSEEMLTKLISKSKRKLKLEKELGELIAQAINGVLNFSWESVVHAISTMGHISFGGLKIVIDLTKNYDYIAQEMIEKVISRYMSKDFQVSFLLPV